LPRETTTLSPISSVLANKSKVAQSAAREAGPAAPEPRCHLYGSHQV
jgi:hypothetical protein